jgi:DNA-directed RNA polymerase specialized sigma subunit
MADYVKNKDLLEELIKCKDASVVSTHLVNMFTLMSQRYSRNFSYKYECDREDCISGGVLDAILYFDRFDPSTSSNAFAYMTSVISNGQMKVFRKLFPPHSRGLVHVSLSNGKIYSL